MSRKVSAWAIALNILIILTLFPVVRFNSVRAQESADGLVEEAGSASIAPSGVEKMNWSSEMPAITPEQQAQLAYWAERTNLSGPKRAGAEAEAAAAPAPAADSATIVSGNAAASPKAPLLPGDLQIYRKSLFGAVIPAGFKSNVMESSVAQSGQYAFFTGNWFAARSTNNGTNWSYVNAYSGFTDFCCDQVTTYDESRDTLFWLRMGSANASGVNKFRLGVSNDSGASFCNYDVFPTNTNAAWTNQWWDYPHIQLGADYLYLAWNMFDAGDNWTRTVMLRWPLDALDNCAGFSYNYYESAAWFTFVPVQGADHTMYFASNWPMVSPFNRLAIWRWHEDSGSLTAFTRTVTAWSFTARGQAVCGSTSGNWAGRTDDRLLSGARYMINGSNLKYPGKTVLAWWWNVKQGGSFPRPYVDGAAFFEEDLTQVSGLQGRPYLYSDTTTCFLYPSAAANKRGDLGMVVNYSTGANLQPAVMYALADDNAAAPPGFNANKAVQASNARPSDNKWGDYNTTRLFMPTQDTWVAGSHYIPGSTNCANCSAPVFFNFGRGRDYFSWYRWRNR